MKVCCVWNLLTLTTRKRRRNPRQCNSSDPPWGEQRRSSVTIFTSLNKNSYCHWITQTNCYLQIAKSQSKASPRALKKHLSPPVRRAITREKSPVGRNLEQIRLLLWLIRVKRKYKWKIEMHRDSYINQSINRSSTLIGKSVSSLVGQL